MKLVRLVVVGEVEIEKPHQLFQLILVAIVIGSQSKNIDFLVRKVVVEAFVLSLQEKQKTNKQLQNKIIVVFFSC